MSGSRDLLSSARDSVLFLSPHLHLASGTSFQLTGRDKAKAGVKKKKKRKKSALSITIALSSPFFL